MKRVKTAIAIGSWTLAAIGTYVIYTAIKKPFDNAYQQGYEQGKKEVLSEYLKQAGDLEKKISK